MKHRKSPLTKHERSNKADTSKPLRELIITAGAAASLAILASCSVDSDPTPSKATEYSIDADGSPSKIEINEALTANETFHTETERILHYFADKSDEAFVSEEGYTYTIAPPQKGAAPEGIPSMSYTYDPELGQISLIAETIGTDANGITTFTRYSVRYQINRDSNKPISPIDLYASFGGGNFWPIEAVATNDVGKIRDEITAVFGVDGGPISVEIRDNEGNKEDVAEFSESSNTAVNMILGIH